MPLRGPLAIAVATATLAAAGPALAAGPTVRFPGFARAYAPSTVRVAPGGSVTWLGDSGPFVDQFSSHPLRSARASEPYSADTGGSFEHTFAAAGIYRYYCMIHGVKTGDNQVAAMSGAVVVTTNTQPTAAFTATPSSGRVGQEFTFDATASGDAEGPVTYAWDFDNDNDYDDAAGPVVRHAFAGQNGGTASLPVQLRVTDANADAVGPESAFALRYVTVSDPPPTPSTTTPPGTGGGGTTNTQPAPRRPRVISRKLRVRAGKVVVRIKVQRPASGKVTLQGANRNLAKGRATLDPLHQKVRLRLTKAGRRLIRPGGIRAARLVATLRDDAGAYFRVTARVRVRR